MTDRKPLAAIENEALRVVEAARTDGFPVRILGGVAIGILTRQALPEPLARTYADIDLAVRMRVAAGCAPCSRGSGPTRHRVSPPHLREREEPRTDTIGLPRLEHVTGGDWGWHTTVADNLERVATAAGELLIDEDAALVRSRAQSIQQAIERAPKSLG